MKRVAVFAHYDRENRMEDYVVYYVKALSECVDHLVFVSDCDVLPEEAEKIVPYAEKLILGRHGEYDFGSYKRGFLYLQENGFLEDADELIFANDSCFGPLFPLRAILDEISGKTWDFWGVSDNQFVMFLRRCCDFQAYSPHVQSYFLIFRPQVFQSSCFQDFIRSVVKVESKQEVVLTYEVGLSQMLYRHGFHSRVWMSEPVNPREWDRQLALYRPFLIKTKSMNYVPGHFERNYFWRERFSMLTDYPPELIAGSRQIKKSSQLRYYIACFMFRLFPFLFRSRLRIRLSHGLLFLGGKKVTLFPERTEAGGNPS